MSLDAKMLRQSLRFFNETLFSFISITFSGQNVLLLMKKDFILQKKKEFPTNSKLMVVYQYGGRPYYYIITYGGVFAFAPYLVY